MTAVIIGAAIAAIVAFIGYIAIRIDDARLLKNFVDEMEKAEAIEPGVTLTKD